MKTIKIIYILAVPTALALFVAWQGARIRARGYRLQDLQRRIEQAKVRRQKYRAQINKLQSPGRILHLVRKHGLELRSGPRVVPRKKEQKNRGKKQKAIVLADETDEDGAQQR